MRWRALESSRSRRLRCGSAAGSMGRPALLTVLLAVQRDAQHEIIDLSALAEADDKPMFRALSTARHRGEVKDTRWSAYARHRLGRSHGRHGPELVT